MRAAEEVRWKMLSTLDKDMNMKRRIVEHVESRFYNKKKTRQGYESKIRMFLKWHEGKKITRESCIAFFKDIRYELAASTYNDYKTMLNKIFSEMGFPFLLSPIKRVKAITTPARYFQKHQIKLLKDYISENEPELWFFIQFIYYCFIRPRSELRILKVSSILFDDRQILIPGKDVAKNNQSWYVSIPDAFWPEVKKIIHRSPNEYIFESSKFPGNPTGMNHFGRLHRKILKSFAFDTEQYKLYSWKHTGAVMAAKAGVGLKALQIQLRHHSLDQVNDYLRQMGVHDHGRLKEIFPAI